MTNGPQSKEPKEAKGPQKDEPQKAGSQILRDLAKPLGLGEVIGKKAGMVLHECLMQVDANSRSRVDQATKSSDKKVEEAEKRLEKRIDHLNLEYGAAAGKMQAAEQNSDAAVKQVEQILGLAKQIADNGKAMEDRGASMQEDHAKITQEFADTKTAAEEATKELSKLKSVKVSLEGGVELEGADAIGKLLDMFKFNFKRIMERLDKVEEPAGKVEEKPDDGLAERVQKLEDGLTEAGKTILGLVGMIQGLVAPNDTNTEGGEQ